MPSRDCHVASLLAMTRYGGFLFLSLRGGAKPRRGNPSPRPPCLPLWGRCPRRGRRGFPRQKRKSPGGGLGIDFFPYHVILKIKRGAAGRREPPHDITEVTVKRVRLGRLLLFYLENQRNDADDQNAELKQVGISDHAITPLRCSGGGKEKCGLLPKKGPPAYRILAAPAHIHAPRIL